MIVWKIVSSMAHSAWRALQTVSISFLLDVSVNWKDKTLTYSCALEYEMPNTMWCEAAIGQKSLEKTEMNMNKKWTNFWYTQMDDERKTFQEELDSSRS